MAENTEKQEFIDWDGERQSESKFERVIVPEENFDFVVKAVELIETKMFQGEGKQKRIKILLSIDDAAYPDLKGKELPHFISPIISKGSVNPKTGQIFSNSKLYDTLVELNIKDAAKVKIGNVTKEMFPQKITDFLVDAILGKKVRASTKISKRNTADAYSAVERIKKIY